MTDFRINAALLKLRRVAAGLPLYARALALRAAQATPPAAQPAWIRLLSHSNVPILRKGALAIAIIGAVGMLSCAGLWWRLGSGPLSVDMATPWLASALEERFGGRHRIEVGGTQLERDEDGRTAIRLRDIVVRDAAGAVVATAPKAEVGITVASLLMGHVRPERLSLIGAEMAVRIERDGQLVVFAGGEQKPFTTASASTKPMHGAFAASMADTAAASSSQIVASASGPNLLAVLLEWLQNLDAVGLDGRDLIEIGLKSGSIAVDDQRSGKLLNFPNIDLSLTRPKDGGAALAMSSMGTDGPWSVNATVVPHGDGRRAIDAVIRDVSPKDILLALRMGSGNLQTDVPLSAVIRAEIDKDGMPQTLDGRIIAGAGYIGELEGADSRLLIDEAQVELRWDAANRQLNAPIEIQSGANRIQLTSKLEAPRTPGGPWSFAVSQGRIQLASVERPNDPPMVLDRVIIRGALNASASRLEIAQADLRGPTGGVALSGWLDFGGEPRLAFGVAGSRMSASTFKRLWPVVFAPDVRAWVEKHVQSGTVEKLVIAGNAPWNTLRPKGPAIPQDGLSINIESSGVTITPVDGLPAVRDVDLVARISGRTATVGFARGSADMPSGRKLTVSNGTFEVADTKAPMSRTKFRLDGAVEAVNELIGMEPLRESAALPYDPGAMRGALAAQVSVGVPLKKELGKTTEYAVDAELTAFSAEKFIRGQRAEAAVLRLSANQQFMQLKGDMKIGGTSTNVDVKKLRAESDAEVRMQATLDDAARARLGIDLGSAVSGPVPVKIGGRMKFSEKESKLSIEADLTQARLTELLPGWTKAPGRPSKATFTLLDKGQSTRLEDLVLEGPGVSVKGSVELDSEGEITNASFPTFGLTDGDKANLKAERASDGTLKVTLRGDLYDGRAFIKSSVAGKQTDRAKRPNNDLDLDIKLGAVTGHHGEALRSLELRMSRRAGQIRSFSMSGKLGHDAMMTGDLRGRGGGRQVIYLETNDAGALFRFSDIYPRIFGGTMSIAMDPPTTDLAPQEGLLNLRDFAVRGEPVLDGVASSGTPSTDQQGRYAAPTTGGSGVAFSRMRVEFTKSPGRFAMRDGIVWGPSVGATVEGHLDYLHDEVRLRGTFVPAYALNNMFGRIPIVGLFLGGGSNEGLLGVTYQVVGSPQTPVLQVNPMSAVAPGFLRKLFEFRGAPDQTGAVPEATR